MNVTKEGKLTGFVAIEKPSTKFDAAGTYSCQVAFTGSDAREMKDTIDKFMTESLSKASRSKAAANPPYTIQDKTLVVKFKQKASIKSRSGEIYEKEIKIYDAANKKVEEPLYMGVGTVVRVAYKPYMWDVASLGAGCTLQPEMVQVIDLVKRDISGGDSNPFESQEGFVAAVKGANPFDDAPKAVVDVVDDDGGDF